MSLVGLTVKRCSPRAHVQTDTVPMEDVISVNQAVLANDVVTIPGLTMMPTALKAKIMDPPLAMVLTGLTLMAAAFMNEFVTSSDCSAWSSSVPAS